MRKAILPLCLLLSVFLFPLKSLHAGPKKWVDGGDAETDLSPSAANDDDDSGTIVTPTASDSLAPVRDTSKLDGGIDNEPASSTAGTESAAPTPQASTTYVPTRASGTMSDRVLSLEDNSNDQQAEIEKLEREIGDIRRFQTGAGYESPFAGFMSRLTIHANMDIIFDNTYNFKPASDGAIGNGNTPNFQQPTAPNGSSGAYFKHTDMHTRYRLDDSTTVIFDYNFAALEVDDMGVRFSNMPLIPFTHGIDGYNYTLFIGQRRQDFGLEQQRDSENTVFPNRALMYGGHNPFGNVAGSINGRDLFNLNNNSTVEAPIANNGLLAELVYDRVMGIHLFQKHNWNWFGYTAGFDYVQDESETSFDGGNPGPGTDSLKAGYPLQLDDQDWSEIGRIGIEPNWVNHHMPWGVNFHLGASAFHDPENTVYLTSQSLDEAWADAYGADGEMYSGREILFVESEFVDRSQYGAPYTGSGSSWTQENVYGGLAGKAESWYMTIGLQPWRIFNPEAPKVELLCRYENFYYFDMAPWMQLTPYTGSYNNLTLGIKWSYLGNNHTSLNYETFGLNNDFSAVGPTELLEIEQQANW